MFLFPQTARSLARESPALARLTLAAAVGLLGAWGTWFSLARVPVYETSEQARLEVLRATQPVEAPLPGRVIEVHVTLDDEVREGEPLVRLDASAQQLELDQTRAKIAGIGPQLAALRKAADAEREALAAYHGQLGADLIEAQSRVREAELHDGQARIELTVDSASATRIPLQHGLPGRVEVQVDEASPARLVLRAAGKFGT